jgi:hypothetical protein
MYEKNKNPSYRFICYVCGEPHDFRDELCKCMTPIDDDSDDNEEINNKRHKDAIKTREKKYRHEY